MEAIVKIFGKIFTQVAILILSTLVFISAIWLLTDLKNYQYIITEGLREGSSVNLDENGVVCTNVHINCKVSFIYTSARHNLFGGHGYEVSSTSGYKAKCEIYLDIYETKNNELVLLETLHENKYSKNFYDPEYARGIKIVPRLENIKYEYPSWRIYVPIFLFILTVPMMGVSIFSIVIMIKEKIRIKKESETPIDT